MARARLACAALALLLAHPAVAAGGDVELQLVLHGRFTDRRNQPRPDLLFDRRALQFELSRYLAPGGEDAYGSGFLSLGASGRSGGLRWAVTADTGEVRSERFPALADVCFARTPSGLGITGQGQCILQTGRRVRYQVETTALGAAQATSNGRLLGDEVKKTLLLREAWAGLAFGHNDFALVSAGRKRFRVGDGFVHDDYGTGVEVRLDLGALGPSWDVGAALFYPTRDFPRSLAAISPMLALRADFLPSLFEHVGLFLALYRDRTGSVAELFQGTLAEGSAVRLPGLVSGTPAYQDEERALLATLGSQCGFPNRPCPDPASLGDATLGWLGTSGSLALLGSRLEFTGALGFGRLTLRTDDGAAESRATVAGRLASLRLRRGVGREVEVGGFLLFQSGDLPPTEKSRLGLGERYGGFLGVSPFVTATNIFFQGGVAETFAARQATAPGVNGRGVLAPGLLASWEPSRLFTVQARAAYLTADERGPFGGRVYGPEVDLEVTHAPYDWLTLAVEADALFPGDFFPAGPAVTKLVVAVDVVPRW